MPESADGWWDDQIFCAPGPRRDARLRVCRTADPTPVEIMAATALAFDLLPVGHFTSWRRESSYYRRRQPAFHPGRVADGEADLDVLSPNWTRQSATKPHNVKRTGWARQSGPEADSIPDDEMLAGLLPQKPQQPTRILRGRTTTFVSTVEPERLDGWLPDQAAVPRRPLPRTIAVQTAWLGTDVNDANDQMGWRFVASIAPPRTISGGAVSSSEIPTPLPIGDEIAWQTSAVSPVRLKPTPPCQTFSIGFPPGDDETLLPGWTSRVSAVVQGPRRGPQPVNALPLAVEDDTPSYYAWTSAQATGRRLPERRPLAGAVTSWEPNPEHAADNPLTWQTSAAAYRRGPMRAPPIMAGMVGNSDPAPVIVAPVYPPANGPYLVWVGQIYCAGAVAGTVVTE